ncbi:MAG: adenylate/guanylate cyclase domain-containing protein [Verrucomicrobiota bacterium]
MSALSFRSKLLLAMMIVVMGVTGATLFATQQRMQAAYERLFEQQFRAYLGFFNALQQTRLSSIEGRCLDFAKSVRLRALMRRLITASESNDSSDYDQAAAKLYQTAEDELREVLGEPAGPRPWQRAAFFRFLDFKGQVLNTPKGVDVGMSHPAGRQHLKEQLAALAKLLQEPAPQEVGYLAPPGSDGRGVLLEVVFTKIMDSLSGEPLGALVVGFPMSESMPVPDASSTANMNQIKSGFWLEKQLHARSIPEALRPVVAQELTAQIGSAKLRQGDLILLLAGEPHRVFFEALNPGSCFPPAYQVCFFSLHEARQQQRDLRWKILGLGGLGLAGALAVSLVLSHGLAVPIRELVAGTGEIQRGNFGVKVVVRNRDEIGHLAASFNEMAEGLALKEKYRSVLDKVADKEVARELMNGTVALGGESRPISVLFCDIRGFTALTQNMDPAEVIRMLNEHFTPLTRVVYEYYGVVDKFVGDLIMAVFGAPKSYGQDADHAARCALRMIEERQKLNETSRHKIQIGIGVATGSAVAGCMGSSDRLNYTVLGERVNLASRLCGQAGRMEAVIDQETYQQLAAVITAEPLPEMKLKGFSHPVRAYKLIQVRPA